MPSLLILYHFFHPDDVVSARLFADIGTAFAREGWRVETWPCNRACHTPHERYAAREDWQGFAINRVWRPPLRQSSSLGRIFNALWMISAWRRRAATRCDSAPDLVLIGTDPFFSLAVTPALKRAWPSTKIVHWCHDLYPEALAAEGLISADNPFYKLLLQGMRRNYASCDLIATLGPCMARRLADLMAAQRLTTLTPWALWAPELPAAADPQMRQQMFGDARLALLYSGNFGRAHQAGGFFALAGLVADEPIRFAFAVRGHRVRELRQAAGRLRNVTVTRMVEEDDLGTHLGSADILLASLRSEWTGIVVPSKFFGALAVGRPVLYDGDPGSSIGRWISDYKVGWVITRANMPAIAAELRSLAARPDRLQALFTHCHAVYRTHFARQAVLPVFEHRMRELVRSVA